MQSCTYAVSYRKSWYILEVGNIVLDQNRLTWYLENLFVCPMVHLTRYFRASHHNAQFFFHDKIFFQSHEFMSLWKKKIFTYIDFWQWFHTQEKIVIIMFLFFVRITWLSWFLPWAWKHYYCDKNIDVKNILFLIQHSVYKWRSLYLYYNGKISHFQFHWITNCKKH